MSVKKEPSGRRSVQVEVEVPGTPEQVWKATDPLTLVAAFLGLLAMAVIAAILPARRALRIDPMTALRCD
jgi:ABC-type lipoprotein release transport system permease subunit